MKLGSLVKKKSRSIEKRINGERQEIALDNVKQIRAFQKFAKDAVRGLDSDIQKKTLSHIKSLKGDKLRSYARYFYEGWLKQKSQSNSLSLYRSDGLTSEVLRKILPFENFYQKKGVDFGFGNGEVAKTLLNLGAEVSGYELSPFFVQTARNQGIAAYLAAIDQDEKHFESEFKMKRLSQDFAIATLVLDRLSFPMRFIRNFFAAIKPGGFFAIQTLLPVVPKDDGPVAQPIVYTSPENQITPGLHLEEDRARLMEVLQKNGSHQIQVTGLTYSVKSLDGTQNYQLWSFNGKKAS